MDEKVKKKNSKLFLLSNIFLVFSLSCLLPAFAVTPAETGVAISESELGTLIAQTSSAARLQTASALPTVTLTGTATRIPSITFTASPTFIYLLPTATLVPSYTPIIPPGNIIVNGTIMVDDRLTGRPWTCLVTGSSPARNLVFKPGTDFVVTWTVLNTGTKTWSTTGIDFVYSGGFEANERAIQDLPRAVLSGDSILLKISLTAPKYEKTYNVYWGLRVGKATFCYMKYVFKVEH